MTRKRTGQPWMSADAYGRTLTGLTVNLIVRDVAKTLADLRREGLSILLVEQSVPFATKVADRVLVLSRGRIVHSCSPAGLLANQEVKSRYLGLGS